MYLTITLDQQIDELKAELALRLNVYRKWIVEGRMKQTTAEKKMAAMRAALHVLMALRRHKQDPVAIRPADAVGELAADRTEEGMPV